MCLKHLQNIFFLVLMSLKTPKIRTGINNVDTISVLPIYLKSKGHTRHILS